MKELHPKIEKNLCDLEYDENLQRCHTVIGLGVALWLALIVGIITWLFEGGGYITDGLIIFFMIATSVLFSLTIAFYLPSKIRRIRIVEKITSLNPKADKL